MQTEVLKVNNIQDRRRNLEYPSQGQGQGQDQD